MDPREVPPASPPQPKEETAEETLGGARVVDSEDLLRGECEIIIRHGSELYRLRRTRQGKLILHK